MNISWKEFIEEDEDIQAKFEYYKKRTQEETVLAVTDKRAFYYHKDNQFLTKKTKSEEFLSSKFPIASIKYKLWAMPLWAWILNFLAYFLIILMNVGVRIGEPSEGDLESLMVGSVVLAIYVTLILLLLFVYRKIGLLSAVVGKENVIILSRRQEMREDAKHFIQDTHALTSIRTAKTPQSLMMIKRKLVMAAIGFILFLVFFILFALTAVAASGGL